jgi:hypothetical protein
MEPFALFVPRVRHRHLHLAPVIKHVKASSIEKLGVILNWGQMKKVKLLFWGRFLLG